MIEFRPTQKNCAPFNRAHPTAEPRGLSRRMSGPICKRLNRLRFMLSRCKQRLYKPLENQGPPTASPGVKGGHCIDAPIRLSSRPGRDHKMIANPLIIKLLSSPARRRPQSFPPQPPPPALQTFPPRPPPPALQTLPPPHRRRPQPPLLPPVSPQVP